MAARILLIEDNQVNLELMHYLLDTHGFSVAFATDGVSGLQDVIVRPPDLMICDIHMPGLDGYEFVRTVKADPSLESIPMLAVTALAMKGDREKILAAGFDGYFSKPIDPEDFVRQVKEYLQPGPQINTRQIPAPPAPVSHALRSATLLVVDDLQMNLDLAKTLFEGVGYKVVTASRMTEALTIMQADKPDLILSDVMMDEGDGFNFIRIVKGDSELKDIPFLFITSTAVSERDRVHGLSLGAAAFIFRPVDSKDLLKEIEDSLNKRP